MHSKTILLTLLFLTAFLATANAATCPKIEQYGITWHFADPIPKCGQFVTDDWWVVGPVTITGIDPASVDLSGRIVHGSMINPTPENKGTQGYDSLMHYRKLVLCPILSR